MSKYNESTVNVCELTLKDWQEIATSVDNSQKWALYNWLECSQSLSQLTMDDWLAVASQIGYKENWALLRYQEYRPKVQETA